MLITRVPDDAGELTEEESRRREAARTFRTTGSGYSVIQATRPQTLADGLTDSPAGQLAWITEKFSIRSRGTACRAPTGETAGTKERVLWCFRCGVTFAAIGLGRRLKPTLLAIFGELVVEEIGQVVVIREDVAFGGGVH